MDDLVFIISVIILLILIERRFIKLDKSMIYGILFFVVLLLLILFSLVLFPYLTIFCVLLAILIILFRLWRNND